MTRSEKSSKMNDQGVVVDSDVDENRINYMWFSLRDPCTFDCETNLVTSVALDQYRKYYEIPDFIKLIMLKGHTAWNPLNGTVAFYGFILACGVTLPIQPYIARFLCDVKTLPAKLAHMGIDNY